MRVTPFIFPNVREEGWTTPREEGGVCGWGGQEEEEARQTSAMVEKRLSQASWSATTLTSKRDQQRSEGKRAEWEREASGRKAAALGPVGALTDCDETLQRQQRNESTTLKPLSRKSVLPV